MGWPLCKHAACGHLQALLGAREEINWQVLQLLHELLPLQHLRSVRVAQITKVHQ